MRLPIVSYPEIIVKNVEKFAEVFHTPEQQKYFCEYVTGLIAGDKATVTAINELYLNKNDQSSLNKFLTQAKWDEDEMNRRRISYELERMQRRPVSAKAGQQWAQQLENKSLWQTYISQLISYHYRQQAYQPKAELGADLVKQAIQLNLPFDVWFFLTVGICAGISSCP